jgi:hypothetical protein
MQHPFAGILPAPTPTELAERFELEQVVAGLDKGKNQTNSTDGTNKRFSYTRNTDTTRRASESGI